LTQVEKQEQHLPDPPERRQVADFRSERWPASNRNGWPASIWNAWPASSESAAVKRDPRAKAARRDEMARSAAPYIHPPIAPIDLDVARRIGRLLHEVFEKLKC
jgi:hypothetical protein